MSELFPFTIDDMIEECRRESIMREAVYPGQVARGKMSRQAADRRLQLMQAIRATLEMVRALGLTNRVVAQQDRRCRCCGRRDIHWAEAAACWPQSNLCSDCTAATAAAVHAANI